VSESINFDTYNNYMRLILNNNRLHSTSMETFYTNFIIGPKQAERLRFRLNTARALYKSTMKTLSTCAATKIDDAQIGALHMRNLDFMRYKHKALSLERLIAALEAGLCSESQGTCMSSYRSAAPVVERGDFFDMQRVYEGDGADALETMCDAMCGDACEENCDDKRDVFCSMVPELACA
jgi:hypothetical protein